MTRNHASRPWWTAATLVLALIWLPLPTLVAARQAAPQAALPTGDAAPEQMAQLEQEARVIDAMLIAPCCYSQQVSVHKSPAADAAKADIRLRLASGETRQQILNAYVKKYGKQVLAEPPAEGFDRTLYVAPFVVLLVSAGLVTLTVSRFTRRGAPPAIDAEHPSHPSRPSGLEQPGKESSGAALETQLDDDLRDLD